MTHRVVVVVAGVTAALALVGSLGGRAPSPLPVAAAASGRDVSIIAGPGLVEAESEELELTPEVGGRLAAVDVDEGQDVVTGQVLARLEDGDYRARVAAAVADLDEAIADRTRLINGARQEERDAARAAAAHARALFDHARTEAERAQRLFTGGVIARERLDEAERDLRASEARAQEAAAHAALVEAPARDDELARASARVAAAEAALAEARASLAKTLVRAPIDGVILRRLKQAGESVSLMNGAAPILTMSDVRTLRVRMEVDERDIGGLKPGQRAWVTADAFGQRRFPGRVVRVGNRLGRKAVRTGEPSERTDTKVLETLIGMDADAALPIGLRVDAFIETRGAR